MPTAVEDLCNEALRRINYPTPIGYIMEGSRASRVAVQLYGQTRDDLLRGSDWDFARQAVGLALLKTAPVSGYSATPWTTAFPPPPWIYEYAYPAGCLMIRSVRPVPVVIPEFDPQPNIFVLGNDASLSPPARVILTNLGGAQAVYTGQVTDPNQWNSSFQEALVEALARRFGEALNPDPNLAKERGEEEQGSEIAAPMRRG
jgi:hypothetical protein